MPLSVNALMIFVFKNWESKALRKEKRELLSWLIWYNKALKRSVDWVISFALSGRMVAISSTKKSRLRLAECKGKTMAWCFSSPGGTALFFFDERSIVVARVIDL